MTISITVNDQVPGKIAPQPLNCAANDPDYFDKLQAQQKEVLVDPLFQPLPPATVASIQMTIDQNAPEDLDPDLILEAITESLTDPDIDMDSENQLGELYRRGLRYADSSLNYRWTDAPTVQQLLKTKLPMPSATIIYSFANDILPASKDLLVNWQDPDYQDAFISAFAGDWYKRGFREQVAAFAVPNDTALKQIGTDLTNYQQQNPNLDQEVIQKITDFNDLVAKFQPDETAFSVLTGDFDPTEDSFSRILQQTLLQQKDLITLPLNVRAIYEPKTFVIFNVDHLAHGSSSGYNKEMQELEQSHNMLNNLGITKIKRLVTAQKVNQKQQHTHQYDKGNRKDQVQRAVAKTFSTKPKTKKQQIKTIQRLVNSQISQRRSENAYRKNHRTHMRPNRRHPDNLDLTGVVTKTGYRPDIHIFLDTSGSISESMYQSSVMMLIKLAKQLNTNLYFTSFSHTIAQPVKLKLKGRSLGQIYQQIQNVPKVSGGTEYENVWRMINEIDHRNQAHGKSYQLSFMITDFEYGVSHSFISDNRQAAVKKTYYLPMYVNDQDYKYVCDSAKEFADQMIYAGCLNIKKHILM